MRPVIVAITALFLAPVALATCAPIFSYDGGFLYGGLEAFYGPDACANGGLTDGLNSDCFDVPASAIGHPWHIAAISDDTGTLALPQSWDAPPAVYDPANAACMQNAPNELCPTSPTLLTYGLWAACFYPAGTTLPTGYLEVIGCSEQPVVPAGTGQVAVVAYPSLNVHFTFVVDDHV